jgi:hypothetical protein
VLISEIVLLNPGSCCLRGRVVSKPEAAPIPQEGIAGLLPVILADDSPRGRTVTIVNVSIQDGSTFTGVEQRL